MNFNFSPGVWANDGSKAVPPLRTISAGGVIEQPRSSALDPRGAQPPYGGFAALGAGFIQRPATDLFPLPTNTRLQLLGPPPPSAMPQALQYPIASIQPILQPPSAFLSAYGAQPAVRGGALGSGAALHGAQQPMQQISAAANAYAPAPPGYNARGGVANSLDAFMGQQRQSQKFYSPAVQALAPGIRPPAGIRCLPSVEARAGSMMTCAAGLTGAQQPATRRAQAGSGQSYVSALEYNGMALATKLAADHSHQGRRVFPQAYDAGIQSSVTGLTAADAEGASSSHAGGRYGDGAAMPRARQTALAILPGGIAPQSEVSPGGRRMYAGMHGAVSQLQPDADSGFMLPAAAVLSPSGRAGDAGRRNIGVLAYQDQLQKAATGITAQDDPRSRVLSRAPGMQGAAQAVNIGPSEAGLVRHNAGADPMAARVVKQPANAVRMHGSVLQSHATGFSPPGEMHLYHLRHAGTDNTAVNTHLQQLSGGIAPGDPTHPSNYGSSSPTKPHHHAGGIASHPDKFKSQMRFMDGGLGCDELPVRRLAVGKQWSTTYDTHFLKQ